MNTPDSNTNRKLSDQDVRDILHLVHRLSAQCTPKQLALAAAIPGDLVAFAEDHDVSLPMLQSILGKLIKTQGEEARRSMERRSKNKGANERLLLDAFKELALNPDDGITEGELLDKAIELKGEPTEQKARNNMKTNFSRALHALVRDGILLSTGGKISMGCEYRVGGFPYPDTCLLSKK